MLKLASVIKGSLMESDSKAGVYRKDDKSIVWVLA
jgi:hypothetical protein